VLVGKADSGEASRGRVAEIDAELTQRRHCFREQTLSAGFVDGRDTRINDGDAQALRPRGNGGRQSGRAASNNQYVRLNRVFQRRLPSEENQFGAESWTHCGQNA
jgi:hypothetical protein